MREQYFEVASDYRPGHHSFIILRSSKAGGCAIVRTLRTDAEVDDMLEEH
jgi:hypothetical protein